MKAKVACLIKGGAISQEEAYRRASGAVGRTLVPGFGLSTCTHAELIKVLDAITGNNRTSPIENRKSSGPPARRQRRPLPLREDGERRPSLGQWMFIRNLAEELRLSDDEFAGICRRATGKDHPTSSRDHQAMVGALKAIKARRLRAGE
jgi:hypothetical protein